MVTAGPRTRRRDEEERIILMKSRDRRALDFIKIILSFLSSPDFSTKNVRICDKCISMWCYDGDHSKWNNFFPCLLGEDCKFYMNWSSLFFLFFFPFFSFFSLSASYFSVPSSRLSSSPVARCRSQSARPDLNRELSGQRRTSPGELPSGVGSAGPHPGSSRAEWAAPDLSCQKRISENMSDKNVKGYVRKECQKNIRKISEIISKRLSEDTSEKDVKNNVRNNVRRYVRKGC